MHRAEMLAAAEVRWHDEFAKALAGLPEDLPGQQSQSQDIT
jgi:hypothetical protein